MRKFAALLFVAALAAPALADPPLTISGGGGGGSTCTMSCGGITQLTGDVTAGPGTNVQDATIPAATVTLAKMANLAANSIIGNNTGAGATPIALTAAQVKTLLAIAPADLSGLGTGVATALGTAVSGSGGMCLATGSACISALPNVQSGAAYTIGNSAGASCTSDKAASILFTYNGGAIAATMPAHTATDCGAGFRVTLSAATQQVTLSMSGGDLVFANGTSAASLVIPAGTPVALANIDGTNFEALGFSFNASLLTSGTVAVARGGTNLASYTTGDVLYASGATTIAKLADVATGQVLHSGGVAAAPAYSAVALGADVSGTLPKANGGTGGATGAAASTNLSLPYTLTQSHVSTGSVAAVVETKTVSAQIPANALGANGSIRVYWLGRKVGVNGACTVNIRFGTTNDLAGTLMMTANGFGAGSLSEWFTVKISNRNTTNSQISPPVFNTQGASASDISTAAIDTTGATWLVISVTPVSASDTITTEDFVVWIDPAGGN